MNKVELRIIVDGEAFDLYATGEMTVIPQLGATVTITKGPQRVESVNHNLQSGIVEIRLQKSNRRDLLQRYNCLKSLGYEFAFNSIDEEIERFIKDAENEH